MRSVLLALVRWNDSIYNYEAHPWGATYQLVRHIKLLSTLVYRKSYSSIISSGKVRDDETFLENYKFSIPFCRLFLLEAVSTNCSYFNLFLQIYLQITLRFSYKKSILFQMNLTSNCSCTCRIESQMTKTQIP